GRLGRCDYSRVGPDRNRSDGFLFHSTRPWGGGFGGADVRRDSFWRSDLGTHYFLEIWSRLLCSGPGRFNFRNGSLFQFRRWLVMPCSLFVVLLFMVRLR